MSRRWLRSIEVERWDRVEREGWCEDVPEGAKVLDRGPRISPAGRLPRRHAIHDHHVAGRSQPWCTWEVVDWEREAPRVAAGTEEPRSWPVAPGPEACPVPGLGCLRGAERTEQLLVRVQVTERDAVDCPVSEDRWVAASEGQAVDLPFSVVLGRPRCDLLR